VTRETGRGEDPKRYRKERHKMAKSGIVDKKKWPSQQEKGGCRKGTTYVKRSVAKNSNRGRAVLEAVCCPDEKGWGPAKEEGGNSEEKKAARSWGKGQPPG